MKLLLDTCVWGGAKKLLSLPAMTLSGQAIGPKSQEMKKFWRKPIMKVEFLSDQGRTPPTAA